MTKGNKLNILHFKKITTLNCCLNKEFFCYRDDKLRNFYSSRAWWAIATMKAATKEDFGHKSGRLRSHAPNFIPCPEISFSKFKCPAYLALESKSNNPQCYEFLRYLVLLLNWIFLIWTKLRYKEFGLNQLSYYRVSKFHSHFLSYSIAVIKLIYFFL